MLALAAAALMRMLLVRIEAEYVIERHARALLDGAARLLTLVEGDTAMVDENVNVMIEAHVNSLTFTDRSPADVRDSERSGGENR